MKYSGTYKCIPVTLLRNGCILGTIAEAVFCSTIRDPLYSQYWMGNIYIVQDNEGNRGAVYFDSEMTVGMLHDKDSERNELPATAFDYREIIPSRFHHHIDSITEHFAVEHPDMNSGILATSVFWSDNGEIVSIEPWDSVLGNGAELLYIQSQEINQAFVEWEDNYGFDAVQMSLIESIWSRAAACNGMRINLLPWEKDKFASGGYGISWPRELLAQVGIDWD